MFRSASMLLSIGDQVEPGRYAVHSRFKRVVNFVNRDGLVFLVEESIGAGPLNIVLGKAAWEVLSDVPPFRVEAEAVVLGSSHLSFSDDNRYDSQLHFSDWSAERLANNLEVLKSLLCGAAPPKSLAFLVDCRRLEISQTRFERAFTTHIVNATDQVFAGNLMKGIGMLKGCGYGLTPAGDDFVAGMLIAMNLLEQVEAQDFRTIRDAICHAAVGNNTFSNAFLDLARRGRLFEPMKDLIVATLQGGSEAVRTCTARLFRHGETSGADLATGFLMTLCNREAVLRWSNSVGVAPRRTTTAREASVA